MKILLTAVALAFALAAGTAHAASCEAQAAEKKLSGAAKTSFIKKCEKDAGADCATKAVDKNGKPLAGAAKDSFIKKCEKDAGK